MAYFSLARVIFGVIVSALITVPFASVVLAADTVPPVIGTVTPTTATAGESKMFTVNVSDDGAGVSSCYFIIDTVSLSGEMSRASGDEYNGTYKQYHTFASAGSYQVAARCADRNGNLSTGASVTITVSAPPAVDASAPFLGTLSPGTGSVGAPITFQGSYSDDIGVTACEFDPGSGTRVAATRTGSATLGTASYVHTFASPGTYTVSMRCGDAVGNLGLAFLSVTISGSGPDMTPPVVRPIIASVATVGVPLTIGAEYSDNIGVAACFLTVNGSSVGFATMSGTAAAGTASRAHTFTVPGTYTVNITCRDAALNSGDSGNRTITVSAASPAPDVAAPTFTTALSPLAASVNTPVTLQIGYADNVGVTECYLYVDGSLAGGASSGGVTGVTSRSHTFSTSGAHAIRFQCRDAAGNRGESASYTITVAAAPASAGSPGSTGGSGGSGSSGSSSSGGSGGSATSPVVSGSAPMGTLIKAVCPTTGVVNADHPCRAVYYYGQDGRRHAFPNERVYFTWFSDFSGVREVSAATMASITLGRNVTYRPGSRMIKFRTVNRVYAVSRGGTLRWITTEDVARQLYGSNWATKVDDVGDTFYSNYTPGSDITLAAQFNISSETSAAPTIDQNW